MLLFAKLNVAMFLVASKLCCLSQELQGRTVRVSYATERARPGFGGGGGYGGGGYGGGGGYSGGGGNYGGGGYGGGGGNYGGGGYGGGSGNYGGGGGSTYGRNDYNSSGSYASGGAPDSYTGGHVGTTYAAGGEFSSNSNLGYDGQLGSHQDGGEPLENNHVPENNDQSDDYAETRR